MGLFGVMQKSAASLPVKAKTAATPIATKPEHPAVAAAAALPVTIAPDALPVQARAKAIERLKFVRLVSDIMRARRYAARAAVDFIKIHHVNEFQLLLSAGQNGKTALTYDNFRRWKAACNPAESDEANLANLTDSNARGVRERFGDAAFWQLFFAAYLQQNKLSVTAAYELARAAAVRDNRNAVIPSIHQVQYRVSQIPPETAILAREGNVAWRNRCCDFITRDWSGVAPGELAIGDSRTFDTRVKVYDEVKQKFVAVRPTIAALMDARSWFIVSYWITVEPVNTDTLINTLALYCHNTAGQPPATCYFDNGKDYTAQGFSTPLTVEGGHEHSIFQELGIKLVTAIPYNARAKTIEPMFKRVMERFDKWFPDYLGSRPGQRTDAANYYDDHPEELPSLNQFCEIFAPWLNEYHNTPKNGLIHKGESPAAIWSRRPDRAAFSGDYLHAAFCKPEGVRTVERGPAVRFERERFYSDALRFGDKVLVKSDPVDPSRVVCYTLKGELISEARTREALAALVEDDAGRARLKELIARQRRQAATARTMLNDLTGGRHQASPLELLLAPADASLVKLGSKGSVKGKSHRYDRISLAGFEFAEDEEEAKLAAFGEVVKAAEAPVAEAEQSPDLADFHNFMTNRRNDEY